jgi:hypothetical protein
MNKIVAYLVILIVPVAFQSHAGPAYAAGATNTWVSATGNNSNSQEFCPASTPCASFSAALSVTRSGGRVSCLGAVDDQEGTNLTISISISVTIDCFGTTGGFQQLSSATNGVVINAPGQQVTLRGLHLDGTNAPGIGGPFGEVGILIQAAAVVDIEDCEIENWAESGISIATSANTILNVKNTSIRNSTNGISVAPTGGAANGSIDHTKITKITGDGITASGSAFFTVTNSLISNVAGIGVNSATGAVLEVDSSSISNNRTALATSGGILRVSRNVIYDNTTNFSILGGTIATRGDNKVAVNGATVPNGTIAQ